jgi:hypothetical protein
VILPALAIGGSMAGKRVAPPSPGTFPTNGVLFIILLVAVDPDCRGADLFPGPEPGAYLEQLLMRAGTTSENRDKPRWEIIARPLFERIDCAPGRDRCHPQARPAPAGQKSVMAVVARWGDRDHAAPVERSARRKNGINWA